MDDRNKGWFWLILVLSVVLTVAYVQRRDLFTRYFEYKQHAADLAQAEQEREELEAQLAVSRERAEHLGTDPTEIEAAIRRSKGLVREGEVVFRIEHAPREN